MVSLSLEATPQIENMNFSVISKNVSNIRGFKPRDADVGDVCACHVARVPSVCREDSCLNFRAKTECTNLCKNTNCSNNMLQTGRGILLLDNPNAAAVVPVRVSHHAHNLANL